MLWFAARVYFCRFLEQKVDEDCFRAWVLAHHWWIWGQAIHPGYKSQMHTQDNYASL